MPRWSLGSKLHLRGPTINAGLCEDPEDCKQMLSEFNLSNYTLCRWKKKGTKAKIHSRLTCTARPVRADR